MIVRRGVIIVLIGVLIGAVGLITVGGAPGASASVTPVFSQSGKPLTKAQFVSQANGLCATAVTQFAAVSSQFAGIKSNPTPSEITAFINALAPIVQKQINKTRALNAPKNERARVVAMLRADQVALNKVKADPMLLGAKTSPWLAADALARKLGLEGAPGSGACSKGSASGGGG